MDADNFSVAVAGPSTNQNRKAVFPKSPEPETSCLADSWCSTWFKKNLKGGRSKILLPEGIQDIPDGWAFQKTTPPPFMPWR